MSKTAITSVPIHDILAERWSARAYTDQPVEPEKLISLFEAVRWTASSRNDQPWRFLVATKDNPDAWEKMFSVLKEGNQRWAKDAYVLMVTATLSETGRNAQHDLGQAVANLSAQATAHGLALRQMGGIERDKPAKSTRFPLNMRL